MDKKKITNYAFKATQLEIDELKNRFFSEGDDFVYFRKGEWHGFNASKDSPVNGLS